MLLSVAEQSPDGFAQHVPNFFQLGVFVCGRLLRGNAYGLRVAIM